MIDLNLTSVRVYNTLRNSCRFPSRRTAEKLGGAAIRTVYLLIRDGDFVVSTTSDLNPHSIENRFVEETRNTQQRLITDK